MFELGKRSNIDDLQTAHHPDCPNYDKDKESENIIKNLIEGIDCWCNDADGIHSECWEAYNKARIFVGMEPMKDEQQGTPTLRFILPLDGKGENG